MPTSSLLQVLVLSVLPHGGQRTARRNAWAGMSYDAAQGRARREAAAALTAAEHRAAVRTRSTG
jgi:hypothetical protein